MPRVIFASGFQSDMFYATRMKMADPFFFLDLGEKKYVFFDRREIDVFAEHNTRKDMQGVLLDPFIAQASAIKEATPLIHRLALVIFQAYGLEKGAIDVAPHFPLDLADYLRARGFVLNVCSPFFPERAVKEEGEVAAIEGAIQKTHVAYQYIEEVLHASIIQGDAVLFEGAPLTSEMLKAGVDRVLLEEDMVNTVGPIISCGAHAAIPHHLGHGAIKAGQPIICDIFPVHRTTGYFADMTRTYVKGEASKEMQKIYDAVQKSQEAGMAFIKPGVKTSDVHAECCRVFLELGYDVGDRGFIHGTGHGLGLDIHEPPFLKPHTDVILEPGHVVTVEPGLYYADRGSTRIEDVVVVTKDGCRDLTRYPKHLVIS